ncbi:MAG TPA: peptidoglycan DD-metalloendopeptidase family protein [Candidatus Methylomirabilis sp.]|nr:peptidoglycan DD-metalloendopeptidase family protein [Candidatus Methylomirabilis sp.]
MRYSRALVPIALAILSLAGGLHADEQGTLREKKQRLERLKKEIQEERKKAHETAAKEAAAEATLKRVQEQLDKKTQELTALEANLRAEERALRELRQETTHTERELGEITERWASRLRALYKQGQYGVFRLLFSAESVTDMVRRMKYLKIITAQDRTLSGRYAEAVTDLGKKQTTLESRKAALEKSRNRIRATEAAIADEKWRQRILLARLREEKEGYLTAVRELETVSGRLQDLINQLSKRAKAAPKPSPALPSGAFFAVKGKLPWPTSGDVASRFGRNQHPKFNTATFNKGVGIRAPLGQQIQVVHDGTVLYADWFRGYGKLVIVDHGEDFYSLYAHASDLLVQVGDAVRVGQPIGRVGETGSLEGPQLYFELRYRGEPQDPLAWLSPRP